MNKEIKKAGRLYYESTRVGTGKIGEFKRAQSMANKVILEVGPSETPFPIYGEKKMKEDKYYIGMDINSNKVEETVNLLNLVGFPKDKVMMMTAGVTRRDTLRAKLRGGPYEVGFPLRDGSVKEVIMCNVVGDPRLMEKIEKIMEEAVRVLDPNGEIVVVQTRAYLYPIQDLELWMRKRGLKLTNKNLHDIKEINQYRPSEGNAGEYIAKFSRISK